jgi:hypothetical protein
VQGGGIPALSSVICDEQAREVGIRHDVPDEDLDGPIEICLEDVTARLGRPQMSGAGIAWHPCGDSLLQEQRTVLVVEADDAADVGLNGPPHLAREVADLAAEGEGVETGEVPGT